MSETQFLVFVLELFIIRCKNKLSENDLKELRFDVINIARRSIDIDTFKRNLKMNALFGFDTKVAKYKHKFLLYLSRFDNYCGFINHNIDKLKCYEL